MDIGADSNMLSKEIVISAYDKNLDWLNGIGNDTKKTIYRKGSASLQGDITLDNVGRCVHTFFNHIYRNYSELSDITFFAQDYPFDHWEDLVQTINTESWLDRCAISIDGYFGFHFNTIGSPGKNGGKMWTLNDSTHHGKGKILKCSSNGRPQDLNTNINVDSYWSQLFKNAIPTHYEFIPGGHFGITREAIHSRRISFYANIVEYLEKDVNAPWVIERLECYIFNKEYKSC
jgi:hypothetical protein